MAAEWKLHHGTAIEMLPFLAEIFDDSDSEMEIDTENDESSDDQGDDESSSEGEKRDIRSTWIRRMRYLYCVACCRYMDRITLVRHYPFYFLTSAF